MNIQVDVVMMVAISIVIITILSVATWINYRTQYDNDKKFIEAKRILNEMIVDTFLRSKK